MKSKFLILLASLSMLQASGNPNDTNKNAEMQLVASGEKTYVAKEPFHILVKENFPDDKSMLLAFPALGLGAISFRIDDNSKDQTKRAMVTLPSGLDIGLLLDKNGKAQGIIEFLFAPGQKKQMIKDLNMDGIWDTKVLLNPAQSFIFMQSEWLQVTSITDNGTDVEAILNNKKFSFDRNSGQWKEKK